MPRTQLSRGNRATLAQGKPERVAQIFNLP